MGRWGQVRVHKGHEAAGSRPVSCSGFTLAPLPSWGLSLPEHPRLEDSDWETGELWLQKTPEAKEPRRSFWTSPWVWGLLEKPRERSPAAAGYSWD